MDDLVFDVAFSFAGEDRVLVSEVAKELVALDVLVFYDDFYSAELLGKELVSYLRNLYGNRARYCAVFVSESYINKKWPHKVEFPAILERSVDSNDDYLIPIRLDETDLTGLLDTVGYLDATKVSASEIAALLAKKIGGSVVSTYPENALFSKLSEDEVFIGRFISMFKDSTERYWVKYDLGTDAVDRFSKRHQFGSLLESYELAEMTSNFGVDDVDIGISIDLTEKGLRMRNHLCSNSIRSRVRLYILSVWRRLRQ